MKIKIKDREAIRRRKRFRKWEAKQRLRHTPPSVRPGKRTLGLILGFLAALFSGCATAVYTPSIATPPRLVLQQPAPAIPCRELEPLPFVKHSLAELEADEAAELRAHPEREAREAQAVWQLNEFIAKWGQP